MKHVAKLKSLRTLNLGCTHVDDAGLAELQVLAQLRSLDLQDCEITAVGMGYLGKIKSLRELSLYDTHITNAGLRKLEPIGELDSINLNGCETTQQESKKWPSICMFANGRCRRRARVKFRIPHDQSIYGVPDAKRK